MNFGVVYVMQVSDKSPYEGQPANTLEFKYPTDRAMLKAAKDAISRGMFVTMRSDLIKIDKHEKDGVYNGSDFHNWSASINR